MTRPLSEMKQRKYVAGLELGVETVSLSAGDLEFVEAGGDLVVCKRLYSSQGRRQNLQ